MKNWKTISIVGVGLIGGSIGKAVRMRRLADRVIGVGRNRAKLQGAITAGVLDEVHDSMEEAAAQSDLVIICTPVDTIRDFAKRCDAHCRPGTIITDVGSTKADIVTGLEGQMKKAVFIGSHPLAGGHETGWTAARQDLFVGRIVVVTPDEQTPTDEANRLADFWGALGANVFQLSPQEHDLELARTSHMPHVLASALAASTPDESLPLTASGWGDTTRIALGDTELWTQIFRANQDNVVRAIDQVVDRLQEYRAAIADDAETKIRELWREGMRKRRMTDDKTALWEIDIYPAQGQPDRDGVALANEAQELGLGEDLAIAAVRGFLLQGKINDQQANRLASELLSDQVVETTVIGCVGDKAFSEPPSGWNGSTGLIHVLLKPGVMDPVAQSAQNAMADFDTDVAAVRTFRKYWVSTNEPAQLDRLSKKLLANDSIEQVVIGPLEMDRLELGSDYEFQLLHVPIRELDDDGLLKLSKEGQLYLTLAEMQTIQKHFQELDRDPTDIELESVAQTWSEHCSHKTLAGRIAYRDEKGERRFENMLKETIFAATQTIRGDLGDDDWCVSVFEDNAGIVDFDDEYNVVFKVETHNHLSALEPYGGANTGIGGVIRDPLGTGLGAKPICNTDVFCFAPPDTNQDDLPAGVLHPKRVMRGVVSGVRDYGNRMGIPTVNGAVFFDPRYLGNPLVYCGNVGIIPKNKTRKKVQEGDWIVAIGGRTGRDGIHGATFSSAELTSESEQVSGGAVQIGNAITEKMLMDVLIQARDLGLYSAVTDCGAGGFSSAVGEMGEEIGAEVWLDRAPLKYDGLSYTEIWISEAQERMVLAVPEKHWETFKNVCNAEGVEATIIGRFEPTQRLVLKYQDNVVGDLSMEFLHDGRPPIVRDAVYEPAPKAPLSVSAGDHTATLHKILGSLNVASKEWIIRQYDHEVQGGSVIKPLVGVQNDGPSDAAVVRPRLDSHLGVAISCGMNPHYGDYDTYAMAASAIDEAVRNCVAVGADPSRIAILDNFCWGYTDRPETLGSLVRAALACQEIAVAWKTPFISGKDSLNNEFSYFAEDGEKQTIAIPSTLLISAMGRVADVKKCVTMDLKQAGNLLFILGGTKDELAGSHYALVNELQGGDVPQVDVQAAQKTFVALHEAIQQGLVRSCHDLSEGGLAVAVAEMAFAGGLGANVDIELMPLDDELSDYHREVVALFSESNSRFVCEVAPDKVDEFLALMQDVNAAHIGEVNSSDQFEIVDSFSGQPRSLLKGKLSDLKESWQSPLAW